MSSRNYADSIKILQRALSIYEKAQKTNSLGDVLGNLGIAYQEQKEFDQALEAHKRALAIYENQGNNASHSYHL